MNAKTYQNYEEAAQEYLSRFRALRDAPRPRSGVTLRGTSGLPVETLIQHADDIADVSAMLVPLAKEYLSAPDPNTREGISAQLLVQAAAELQIATELLQYAAGETAGEAPPSEIAPRGVTPVEKGPALSQTIDQMEKVVALPVTDGLATAGMVHRALIKPGTPDEARQKLIDAADTTTSAVARRVVEIGGDLTFNLVFKTEWTAVIQSAGLLSKDVGALLDKLKAGLSQIIQRAVSAAVRTLLNVYDKILALLGKDIKDQARQRIQQMLEEIQKAGKIEMFEQWIGDLYQVKAFKAKLPGWLDNTPVGVEILTQTTADVEALSVKFSTLVGYLNSVGDVIGLSKFLQAQFPQVLVVATAIRVVLLTILVYGGYDYVGYGQTKFLNLTKGISEVIQENLQITA